MAIAGEIAVNVVARTRGYTRGLNRAKKETLGFKSALAGTIGKVGSFIGVAGGIAGAMYAASRAVRGLTEQLRSLDVGIKTAKRLGLAHAELVGLRNAAEISGVGVSTLDMALQRMTRRVAEAAQGTGEAKAAIAELGLSAKSLAQRGPYQAFLQIAGAMKGVTTQSDRVRLAFKLFDSEGVKLVNTLQMGRQELDAFRLEAIRTGEALDDFSQRQVEGANDAMAKASQGWRGFKTGMAVRFAPVIRGHGKTMQWFGGVMAGTRREIVETTRVLGKSAAVLDPGGAPGRAAAAQRWVSEAKAINQATKAREAQAKAARDQEKIEKNITREMIKRQQFTGAAARGTTEAFSAIVQGRAERQRQVEIEKQQLAVQNDMKGELKVIADHTQEMVKGMGVLTVQDLRS